MNFPIDIDVPTDNSLTEIVLDSNQLADLRGGFVRWQDDETEECPTAAETTHTLQNIQDADRVNDLAKNDRLMDLLRDLSACDGLGNVIGLEPGAEIELSEGQKLFVIGNPANLMENRTTSLFNINIKPITDGFREGPVHQVRLDVATGYKIEGGTQIIGASMPVGAQRFGEDLPVGWVFSFGADPFGLAEFAEETLEEPLPSLTDGSEIPEYKFVIPVLTGDELQELVEIALEEQ